MERQHNLHLHTPERTVAPEDSFLIRPEQVDAWVSALPMANLGETSRQLFKTIVEFNRLDIPLPVRIKVAELFRRPIGLISEGLRRYYFDVSFPLSAKNRKAAVLNRELHSELALSYKIFIENLLAGRPSRIDKKLLVIAIHRAMRSLLWVLYQSAIIYDPYPRHTWQEIHRLYAYAEKRQFHDIPVKDGEAEDARSTVSSTYLQALLFSISGPYHLRQREIEHVFLQLPAWSKRAQLGLPGHQAALASRSLFVTRLESDAPPAHRSLLQQEINGDFRLLDTGRLIEMLRDHYEDMPSDSIHSDAIAISGQTAKHLLRKLILVFRSTHKRKFARTSLNLELNNVVGLSRVHLMLSVGESGPIAEQEPEEEEHSDPQVDWFEPPQTRPLINTLLYSSRKSENYRLVPIHQGEKEEEVLASDVDAADFGTQFSPAWKEEEHHLLSETFMVKTLNESAGGYCIQWRGQGIPGIKVGEILGIQSASDSRQFSIGVSRWIKNTPGVGLHVGVEMLSPTSSAATARLAEMEMLSEVQQKCLLLPELEVADQPATLLLPALPFKPGDRVLLTCDDSEQQVRLTRLLEITGSFARFRFTEESDTTAEHRLTKEEEETDFDSIWSDL